MQTISPGAFDFEHGQNQGSLRSRLFMFVTTGEVTRHPGNALGSGKLIGHLLLRVVAA